MRVTDVEVCQPHRPSSAPVIGSTSVPVAALDPETGMWEPELASVRDLTPWSRWEDKP